MRLALILLSATVSAAAVSAAALPPVSARLQPDIVCLDPDIEFPVACDDEE